MPTKNRQPNNSGIHAYLANKRYRAEATLRITCDGECYYIVNGHHITEQELNAMYPLELLRPNKKGNTIGHKQQVI